MADFAAQFLLNDFGYTQGVVDSIRQEVFFDVSAQKTSPLFSITPTTGSSITRTASIQVDVTDDTGVLSDVTIWATLADGSTETIWDGSAFTSLFSGSTSTITLGRRYTFAYGGFGWPTTAVTISVKAVDTVGAAGGPTSAAYTISNPPTAPTITNFVPATGGSQTRTATVQVDITDAEGASALALVQLTAITADGKRYRVAAGGTFYAPFTAGSSRSSIANGFRYIIAWDTPGWPSTTKTLLVEAQNTHQLSASSTWTATISNPPAAPMVVFTPASGGSMARAGSVQVDVTDDEGAASLVLMQAHAILDDGSEQAVVVGSTFKEPFTAGSSRSSISGGYRFILAWDSPGWPSTTAGLRFDAADAQGLLTSVTWTATITDPPAAPVVGNFSPADGGTTTRAGTVRIDVTDDELAAAIAYVKITAQLSDGTVRVVYDGSAADDFGPEVDDGSTRTSITGGYRFTIVYDGEGWPSSSLLFAIRAEDAQGRATTAALSLTITDPPPPPDVTAPTVTFSPPSGSTLPPGGGISITIQDPSGVKRVVISVAFPKTGQVEMAWKGTAFTPFYAAGSSLAMSDEGTEAVFVIARTGGWPSDPSPDVIAIDHDGNEA